MQKFDINKLDFEKLSERLKMCYDRRISSPRLLASLRYELQDFLKDADAETVLNRGGILTNQDIKNCIKRVNRRKFPAPTWQEVDLVISSLIEMKILEIPDNRCHVFKVAAL